MENRLFKSVRHQQDKRCTFLAIAIVWTPSLLINGISIDAYRSPDGGVLYNSIATEIYSNSGSEQDSHLQRLFGPIWLTEIHHLIFRWL